MPPFHAVCNSASAVQAGGVPPPLPHERHEHRPSTHRQAMAERQVEPSYMRKIAADDLYMQICKTYSESDSPFGLLDCDRLVDALRGAFAREVASGELNWTPQHTLLPVLRNFVGVSCAYERELCDILGRMYRAVDGVHVNASRLLDDFASILSARSQPPTRADGRTLVSKVELRHALTAWIADALVSSPPAPRRSPPHTSPSRGVASPPMPLASPPPRPAASPPLAAVSPTRRSPVASVGYAHAHHGQTLATHRAGASALSGLIVQSEKASRENERALADAEDLLLSWQQRVSTAEHEARVYAEEKERAESEQARLRAELASSGRHSHVLEERITLLDRRHAEALSSLELQMRELSAQKAALETRVAELDSAVSITAAELGAAERANASLREQRTQLIEEMSELKREHAAHMNHQHSLAHEQREAAQAAAAEAAMRARADYDAMRADLTSRLQIEQERHADSSRRFHPLFPPLTQLIRSWQESVSRLRSEVKSLKHEAERVANERAAERHEFQVTHAHQADIARANASRLESQIASIESQAALELEKLRSQMADERQHSQTMVMEAKHETARAKAETLQAREDALRWQRATSPIGSSRTANPYMSP
ncbi:hypothetical protein AB1Y20_012491 [Prymnesium parvum]|uniref:Uncharacterized protein n=1 Tax=Prymnesium parvum TaxID=97485 RepID=A0AB34IKF9_PRYPA